MGPEQFRRLVEDRIRRIAEFAAEDLPEVSVDSYLEPDNWIDDDEARTCALKLAQEAICNAAQILLALGIDDDK